MKLILHHFLKDVRLQRWLLLIWALALAVPILLDSLVVSPNFNLAQAAQNVRDTPVATFVAVVVWILVIARLIQSEPVTGTTSFWLVRPVPPQVYLSSKLSFLLLLVLLPAVVPILHYGHVFYLPAGLLWAGIANNLLLQCVVGIWIIWLATYSRSLLQFAGAFCLCFVGLILSLLLFFSHNSPIDQSFPIGRFIAILTLGLFVSHLVQYLTKQTRVAFWTGIGSIFMAVASAFVLPTGTYKVPSSRTPAGIQTLSESDLAIDWARSFRWLTKSPIQAALALKPIPHGFWQLVIDSASSTFQPQGEARVDLPNVPRYGLNRLGLIRNLSTINVARLDVAQFVQADLPGYAFPDLADYDRRVPRFTTNIFYVGADAPYVGKTGTLDVNVTGQMACLQHEATIALSRPGEPNFFSGGVVRLEPDSASNEKSLVVWLLSYTSNLYDDRVFVLVNPGTRTARILNKSGMSSNTALVSTMTEISEIDNFNLNPTDNLDGAELRTYRIARGPFFQATLTKPDFLMKP